MGYTGEYGIIMGLNGISSGDLTACHGKSPLVNGSISSISLNGLYHGQMSFPSKTRIWNLICGVLPQTREFSHAGLPQNEAKNKAGDVMNINRRDFANNEPW